MDSIRCGQQRPEWIPWLYSHVEFKQSPVFLSVRRFIAGRLLARKTYPKFLEDARGSAVILRNYPDKRFVWPPMHRRHRAAEQMRPFQIEHTSFSEIGGAPHPKRLECPYNNKAIREIADSDIANFKIAEKSLPPRALIPTCWLGVCFGSGCVLYGVFRLERKREIFGGMLVCAGGLLLYASVLGLLFSPILLAGAYPG